MKTGRVKRGERGIAMITAIWLSLIGVMIVTTMASMIQSTVLFSAASTEDAKTRATAIAIVEKIVSDLIRDRPAAAPSTVSGIIVTEVRNAPEDVNVLTDPSFEAVSGTAWPGHWDTTTTSNINLVASPTDPMTGPNSARFGSVTATAANREVRCTAVVYPGSAYTFGCWIKVPGAAAVTDITFTMIVEWRQANYTLISSTTPLSAVNCGNTAYTRFASGALTAPVGAAKAIVRYQLAHTGTTRVCYIDDAFCFESDRRQEYIEIQNQETQAVNVPQQQYWIAVGQNNPGANHKRYLVPLWNTDSTLQVGDVALVVARDADTYGIAAKVGLTTSDADDPAQCKWFGLSSAVNGVGVLLDTALCSYYPALTTIRELNDGAENIVIGYAGSSGGVVTPPTTSPYWTGIPFTAPGASALSDTSWTRSTFLPLDKITSPFDTFATANWSIQEMTPFDGVAASGTSGRSGYDGAFDTWYRYNYDTFTLLFSDGKVDYYYRARVFDEGSKVNVNYLRTSTVNRETEIFSWLFTIPRAPTFTTNKAYNYAQGNGLCSDLTRHSRWQAQPFLTPLSPYAIFSSAAYTAGYRNVDSTFIPFLTIYGYQEPSAFTINVNTAESQVLAAAFMQMLANNMQDSCFFGAGCTITDTITGRARARSIGYKVWDYLTNYDGGADAGLSDDTCFYIMEHAYNKLVGGASPLLTDASEIQAVQNAWSNGRFSQFLSVSSNHYFTVFASAFAFRKGANVLTDTPLATSRVIAVAHRWPTEDKARYLYWREIFELANAGERAYTFPIGSRRYPKQRWDPNQ